MLKGVEDFHGGVGLGAGMIGVGDGFASDFLRKIVSTPWFSK